MTKKICSWLSHWSNASSWQIKIKFWQRARERERKNEKFTNDWETWQITSHHNPHHMFGNRARFKMLLNFLDVWNFHVGWSARWCLHIWIGMWECVCARRTDGNHTWHHQSYSSESVNAVIKKWRFWCWCWYDWYTTTAHKNAHKFIGGKWIKEFLYSKIRYKIEPFERKE